MTKRTYTHLGNTFGISMSHLTDTEMAGHVRMLLRTDLHHEAVCVGARDRILCLAQENEKLVERFERLKRIENGIPQFRRAEQLQERLNESVEMLKRMKEVLEHCSYRWDAVGEHPQIVHEDVTNLLKDNK